MINRELTYQHGKYNFALSVENIKDKELKNKLIIALEKQFKSFINVVNKDYAIEFNFTDDLNDLFSFENSTNIGNVLFNGKAFKFVNSEISFVYENVDKIHKIWMKINKASSIKSNIRLLQKSYVNDLEKQVSVFYYRLFLSFTQYVNIENGSTYIHGASIADADGNAIIFPADSGVGKSSLLFKLSEEKKYSYIADDLSIIDDNFQTHYSGRAISTKPYHVKNFPFLSSLIEKEMPSLQLLQWKLLNDNRLVYGIDPKVLYPNKTMSKSKVKKVIHLINTNNSDFALKSADVKQLALASANILMNELFLGLYNINKILSIPGNQLFMPPSVMYEKIFNNYLNLFNHTETYLLEVPYMSHPSRMYDFLVSNKIID